MDKDFMTISHQECLLVYPRVIDSANRHFDVAEKMQDVYKGAALAHLILGCEEFVKAIILLLESKGFEIRRIQGIKRLFRQHSPRHNLLRELFSVWLFARPFLPKWLETGGHFRIAEFGPEGKLTGGFLKEGMKKVLIGYTRARDNFEWWAKADLLKQKGFYSDYEKEFRSPDDVTSFELKIANRYVQWFRSDAGSLVIWLENLSGDKLLAAKRNFRQAQFSEIMEQTINRNHKRPLTKKPSFWDRYIRAIVHKTLLR